MTRLLPLPLLVLLGALLGFFTVLLLPLLFAYYFLSWRPHEWQALSDAANPDTDHGTRYTVEEIDEAYRLARLGAWIDDIEQKVTK